MPIHTLRRAAIVIVSLLTVTACTKAAPADAYGNFEAEEVVVSGESAGQLQRFTPVEGAALAPGQVVAQVDTVAVSLERDQLTAQRASLVAHRGEATEQQKALSVQREIAVRTKARIDRLFAAQAATATQRDQAERDERVLAVQMSGARDGIARAEADIAALDARAASLQDRIRRASVKNPVQGTVLATYVRTGEMIAPSQPLYRVADLDTLTLRLYVTGEQLTAFRIGTPLSVHVDGAKGALQSRPGVVSWVSAKAEFTPTPVQTREDRGNLVYAVKVRVANADGVLKVGMPGDVTLTPGAVAAKPVSASP
jgi:HlyD family secretion protein